ncbi:hypothetical protein [Gulosibacter macacae]|uniref:hypothetical protein n=1 Tax=Gulosibacter macacae TaxID=2488791 RepID=UPI001F34BFB1|nr:hypothetical protein [Gulosibacter macacae]
MSNEHIDSEIADAADGTPFEFTGDWNSRLVATAVHAGTDLRPSLQPLAALPVDERFREEVRTPIDSPLGSRPSR